MGCIRSCWKFSDPLIDCKECKTRHRADKLIEEWAHETRKRYDCRRNER